MRDYDEVAVSIVVTERVRMRLTGDDLLEAVRRLSLLGLMDIEIMDLVMWPGSANLWKYRRRNGIPPPVRADTGLTARELGMESHHRRPHRRVSP